MNIFNRACKLGPGGWKCPCCGPNKKGTDRAKTRRAARSRLKAQNKKEIEMSEYDTVHPRELRIPND